MAQSLASRAIVPRSGTQQPPVRVVGLPAHRRWLLAVIAVSVVGFAASWFALPPDMPLEQIPAMVMLVVFGTLGVLTLVQVGPNTKTAVGVAAIYAAVLMYGPTIGMIVALLSTTFALIVRPYSSLWSMAPSIGIVTLAAGAAGWAVVLVGGETTLLLMDDVRGPIAMGIGAVAMYLTNTVPVAVAADLQTGRKLLRSYLNDQRERCLQYLGLCVLGMLTALVAQERQWAMVLVALPVGIVAYSLHQTTRIKQQTWEAIEQLADTVDLREPYTAQHSRRVADLTNQLCQTLGLNRADTDVITQAARVHDIGKLGVAPSVVGLERPLTQHEWDQMKLHSEIGANILSRMSGFKEGTAIVLHHHERWDGLGYPHGIAGNDIPFGARVIAVCDTFDAMTSDRPYRLGMPADIAIHEISRGSGTQFDPRVVEAFMTMQDLLTEASDVIIVR